MRMTLRRNGFAVGKGLYACAAYIQARVPANARPDRLPVHCSIVRHMAAHKKKTETFEIVYCIFVIEDGNVTEHKLI